MVGHQAAMTMEEQPESSTRPSSFRRGVFFTGSGAGVNITFLFLETVVAARLLAKDSYGTYVLLIVVVNSLVMAVDFGCKTALTQLIASSDRIRQAALAHSALVFRLMVIVVVSALIWLGRDLFVLVDPSGALLRYAAYVPMMLVVTSLDELFLAMLQGFQAYHHMAVAQIVRSVLRLGLSTVFLVTLKLGVMALVYSWIISFMVSAAYQYLVLPLPRRFVCQRSLLGKILGFGFPLQLDRFLWFVSGQLATLLLGTLVGPTAVAYYAVAARIPSASIRLAQSYIEVYFPTMAALLAGGKGRQARWMLDHSLRLISFVVALVALIAVLFGQQIITILFSDKYTASSGAFALLMIALHMTVLVTLMGYTLTSAGFPGRSLGANVIRTTLTVLADLLLIPVLGFMGPAYASLVSYYVANPVCVWLLRRSGMLVTVAPYVKQTALLLLCAVLFWWTQPAAFTYKVAIIVLFVILNIALSTISLDDLRLVLPEAVTRRLGIPQEALSNGRW